MYQVYVPCICITVLSWIGFWIDHKAVPARTGLGITTVLTMVYMLASVNSNLPRVTYLKSIDNFVLVCFGFIFLTSLEYVVAIRFSRNRRAANDRKQTMNTEHFSVGFGTFCINTLIFCKDYVLILCKGIIEEYSGCETVAIGNIPLFVYNFYLNAQECFQFGCAKRR